VEKRFQKYNGKIRLLYMYVREAHPNPRSAPCGSTEDLGWNHQSGNTRSAKERAQRARWLNNDLKLNFPWIIDDVDNEMFWDYWPSGFYVGWLIDCDGTTLLHEPWGWATSRTQWCGLPLADFDELDAYLDAYLADPPACYRGVQPPAHVSLIPAVAHQPGNLGTEWVSDLVLANPTDTEAHITVYLQRWDQDNSEPVTRELTLGAGKSVELRDVMVSTFGETGAAALRLEADQPVVTVSRTFNNTPDGTYGQFIRALPAHHAIGDQVTGHLLMLEESPKFRTNIGLASLSGHDIQVEIELFSADGSSLGTQTVSLPPWGATQLFRFIRRLTKADVVGARATVRVLTEGGRVMAYAAINDNRTGDPTYVEPLLNTYQVDIRIPGAARLTGSNESNWVTDVVLTNAENAAVTATVSKFDRGEEKTTTAGQDLTLEPGESLLIRDVLTTLFQTGGAATIAIHGSRGLMAVGRTYNDVADGTYGQFVPGLDVTANSVLKGGEVGHLLMLEESGADGRRTNLGLVNTISVPVDVKIDFFDEQGNLLGSLEKLVPANGYLQFNRVLKLVSGSGLRNVRAEVNVLSRNRGIIAFASSIDNRTGDPVTQIAWASEEN